MNLQTPDAVRKSSLRSATILNILTEQADSGMLDPHSEAHEKDDPLGKSVFKVPQEKHPPSKEPVCRHGSDDGSSEPFLGECVGRKSEAHEFVRSKVRGWVNGVECHVEAEHRYPKSVYTAFTHSLSCEWTYLQHIVTGCDNEYIPLRDIIEKVFTPALLGQEVLQREHKLSSLPAKKYGLALTNPVLTTSTDYKLSKATPASCRKP